LESSSTVSSKSVLLGIPLREDEGRFAHVDARFTASLLANISTLAQAGVKIAVHQAVGPGLTLDRARNNIVKYFLEQSESTHLFFWDCDTLLLPDAILKLLARNLPIVSGLYLERGMPHRPIIMNLVVKDKKLIGHTFPYVNINDVPYNQLIECDVTPGGMFLTERSVFQTISEPWFLFTGKIGEDIFFSLKATDAGYKQYVDTGVEGIHLVQHPAASERTLQEWAKSFGYKVTLPNA
jgi:GT2 family glycosyltransferase